MTSEISVNVVFHKNYEVRIMKFIFQENKGEFSDYSQELIFSCKDDFQNPSSTLFSKKSMALDTKSGLFNIYPTWVSQCPKNIKEVIYVNDEDNFLSWLESLKINKNFYYFEDYWLQGMISLEFDISAQYNYDSIFKNMNWFDKLCLSYLHKKYKYLLFSH